MSSRDILTSHQHDQAVLSVPKQSDTGVGLPLASREVAAQRREKATHRRLWKVVIFHRQKRTFLQTTQNKVSCFARNPTTTSRQLTILETLSHILGTHLKSLSVCRLMLVSWWSGNTIYSLLSQWIKNTRVFNFKNKTKNFILTRNTRLRLHVVAHRL